jgi:hypothetical protein
MHHLMHTLTSHTLACDSASLLSAGGARVGDTARTTCVGDTRVDVVDVLLLVVVIDVVMVSSGGEIRVDLHGRPLTEASRTTNNSRR